MYELLCSFLVTRGPCSDKHFLYVQKLLSIKIPSLQELLNISLTFFPYIISLSPDVLIWATSYTVHTRLPYRYFRRYWWVPSFAIFKRQRHRFWHLSTFLKDFKFNMNMTFRCSLTEANLSGNLGTRLIHLLARTLGLIICDYKMCTLIFFVLFVLWL